MFFDLHKSDNLIYTLVLQLRNYKTYSFFTIMIHFTPKIYHYNINIGYFKNK